MPKPANANIGFLLARPQSTVKHRMWAVVQVADDVALSYHESESCAQERAKRLTRVEGNVCRVRRRD